MQRKKEHLPSKICPVCSRPFSWRKKWEKNWDTVIYCSERCRRNKKNALTARDGQPRSHLINTDPNH